MAPTATLVPGTLTAPPVEPLDGLVEAEVLGLDAAGTLGFVVERRRRLDAAAAEELRAVTHWADLHRVDHVGAAEPEVAVPLIRLQQRLGRTGVLGVEGELRLAGQGAFGVDEFAVAELAAALGMSEPAGRVYVGQALELRDRLPSCWERVMRGELPAWKGRQIAEQTIPLTADAAGWVDTQLAPFAHKLSVGRVIKAVEAAVLRFDPAEAARRARVAAENRGVWCEERIDGTTRITAITDTPDGVAFDAALTSVATQLGRLGDPEPLHVRRSKAVGILADPQYALALVTDQAEGSQGRTPASAASGLGGPVVHVHLHLDAVAGVEQADGAAAITRVTGIADPGPRPVEAVQRWLTGLRPDAVVKVTPVVDLTAHVAVDAYEVPTRIREQVEHRDLTCRFPWCTRVGGRRGSLDLDHIEAYRFSGCVDPDRPDGRPPPGQTSPANLALLCRFHHRLKTHGGWSYTRSHETVLTWRSPLGRRYSVDEHGTRPLH